MAFPSVVIRAVFCGSDHAEESQVALKLGVCCLAGFYEFRKGRYDYKEGVI